jgi:hypothetical protein
MPAGPPPTTRQSKVSTRRVAGPALRYFVLRADRFAEVLRPDDLREDDLRLDDFFADDFFAADFRAGDFRPGDFLAPDFRAGDFLVDDFRAADFLGEDFLADDFRADVFFVDDFFAAPLRAPPLRAGTLSPSRRASEIPIAIACLRLFTRRPEPPLRSLPSFHSCITLPTLFCAFLPYLAILVPLPDSRDERQGPLPRATLGFRVPAVCRSPSRSGVGGSC